MGTLIAILGGISAVATPLGSAVAAISAVIAAFNSYNNGRQLLVHHEEVKALVLRQRKFD